MTRSARGVFLGRLLALAALLLPLLAGALPARAQGTARCTLRVIHARAAEGGVDPQLADLRVQLTRPPFTGWKSFKLLKSEQAVLQQGGTASFDLPEGRRATLTYKEHLQQAGKHRVRLQLELRKGTETHVSTVLVLDAGGTVLTAGSKHGDGILILGVGCTT